jgi:poly(A) polymerase
MPGAGNRPALTEKGNILAAMIPSRLQWLTEGAPAELAARFSDAGRQLYLVGGSVRDALLGRESSDLDFTTDARPEEIKTLTRDWAHDLYTMGEQFGTIGAVKDGHVYEITTFRSDVYVEESRKPEVSFGDSITDDLERRDFTVNAMAIRLGVDSPELIDPHGGAGDVATKALRTPLGPEISFSEDPLRMLRLFRFMAQLGFNPGREELEAVSRMKARLGIVSAERIREEFSKLVTGMYAAPATAMLVESGLADVFIPEVPALAMEQDPQQHHKDVLAHSIAVMAKTSPDLVSRLAGLLHDIGKPATREFEGKKVTFHHHEVVGARMARARLKELRFPKQVVEDVGQLVFLHMRPHTFKMGWTDSAVRRYVRDAGPLLDQLNELVRSDVTTRNEKRARQIQKRIDELEERIVELRAKEELDSLRPPIDGNELMKYLAIEPGPLVGTFMKRLLEHRIEEGPYEPAEAYAMVRQWAIDEGHGDPGEWDAT